MVMTAVVAVTTCCGSVAVAALRGASLVAAAVLPVTRGALDERRLVGTGASDLSALAGARGARSGSPCEREDRKIKLLPLEDGSSGEAIAHLRVEKPRFLKGSTGTVVAADVATVAPPDASAARTNTSAAHANTSAACAGTSAARAASSVDRLVAGAPAPTPGACSSAASAALGEGARAPTSRGEPAPHRSLPLPLPTTSPPRLPGEKVPAARPARHPPGSSARAGLTPANPGAKRATHRATKSQPSPSEPCWCRREGRARRCGGRTTPAPIRRCWRSSCRECRVPCATPAARSTHCRRAPRDASAAPA
jgi:hypothetical protein